MILRSTISRSRLPPTATTASSRAWTRSRVASTAWSRVCSSASSSSSRSWGRTGRGSDSTGGSPRDGPGYVLLTVTCARSPSHAWPILIADARSRAWWRRSPAAGAGLSDHGDIQRPIIRRVIIQALALVRYPVCPGAQGTVLVQPPEEGDRDAGDGDLRPPGVGSCPQARAGPQPAAAQHGPGRGVDPDRPRAGVPDRRPAGRVGGRKLGRGGRADRGPPAAGG